MTEWRNVRQVNSKARHARLDEKRKKQKTEFSPPPPPPLPDTTKPINAPVPETTILTPQPLSPPANDLQDHVKANGLDYADFDNDTSSPFDNMELKTINEMEELAQVNKISLNYYNQEVNHNLNTYIVHILGITAYISMDTTSKIREFIE